MTTMLEVIIARLAAATPGELSIEQRDRFTMTLKTAGGQIVGSTYEVYEGGSARGNARLFAHAERDLAALVAVVQAAAEWRDAVVAVRGEPREDATFERALFAALAPLLEEVNHE